MAEFLRLTIRGEVWVSYPLGLRFPSAFAGCYPFRGRGWVAKVLYALNRFHWDRMLLRHATGGGGFNLSGYDDVAFFWPSRKRATDRFYGYRVNDGRIVEYLKFAVSCKAREQLAREVKNVRTVTEWKDRGFKVPECLGMDRQGEIWVARFMPLPDNAKNIPLEPMWLSRIDRARAYIASRGYAHGDFCLHNMKACGDDLWLIDWEEMLVNPPILLDELTLFTTMSFFNRHNSIEKIWAMVKEKYAGNPEEKAACRVSIVSMAERRIALGRELLTCWNGEFGA